MKLLLFSLFFNYYLLLFVVVVVRLLWHQDLRPGSRCLLVCSFRVLPKTLNNETVAEYLSVMNVGFNKPDPLVKVIVQEMLMIRTVYTWFASWLTTKNYWTADVGPVRSSVVRTGAGGIKKVFASSSMLLKVMLKLLSKP